LLQGFTVSMELFCTCEFAEGIYDGTTTSLSQLLTQLRCWFQRMPTVPKRMTYLGLRQLYI